MTTQPHQEHPENRSETHTDTRNEAPMPDRYGEKPETSTHTRLPHDPRCRSGWLGQDLDGHPIPCIQCKPHLARRNHLTGGTA